MRSLISLAFVLLAVWFIALVAFKVTGFAIHILLLAAIVLFVVGLVQRSRAGGGPPTRRTAP